MGRNEIIYQGRIEIPQKEINVGGAQVLFQNFVGFLILDFFPTFVCDLSCREGNAVPQGVSRYVVSASSSFLYLLVSHFLLQIVIEMSLP